jgi:hypothetical protein
VAGSRQSGPKNAFDHVGLPARLVFYAGVFCVFAPFALVYDLASPKGLPWTSLVAWSVYSGASAVGWAYAFTRSLRYLWIHVPLTFLVATVFGTDFYQRSGARDALLVQAALCLAVIVLGYVCFVIFISGEGTRTIRLLTEINLAKEIHDYLVPAVDRKTEHLELYGVSAPASEVGGDLLDVHDGDGRTALYVADVTGHGVPAGVTMAMVKSAIRMKLRDRPALSELVSGLNAVLAQTQRPGTLATFAALELGGQGAARYAVAGHPAILHVKASDGKLDRLRVTDPPLGIFDDRRFGQEEVAVAAGDLFVILTDGLTEVFDEKGEEFGTARLERIVEQHAHRPLAEIYAEVIKGARAFGPQLDDQTLLLARVR